MKKVFSKFGAFIGKKKKIVIPVLVTVAVLLLLIAPIKSRRWVSGGIIQLLEQGK